VPIVEPWSFEYFAPPPHETRPDKLIIASTLNKPFLDIRRFQQIQSVKRL